MEQAFFHVSGFEPLPDEFESSSVTDPLLDQFEQFVVRYVIEVASDVHVNHPIHRSAVGCLTYPLNGLLRATLRSESE